MAVRKDALAGQSIYSEALVQFATGTNLILRQDPTVSAQLVPVMNSAELRLLLESAMQEVQANYERVTNSTALLQNETFERDVVAQATPDTAEISLDQITSTLTEAVAKLEPLTARLANAAASLQLARSEYDRVAETLGAGSAEFQDTKRQLQFAQAEFKQACLQLVLFEKGLRAREEVIQSLGSSVSGILKGVEPLVGGVAGPNLTGIQSSTAGATGPPPGPASPMPPDIARVLHLLDNTASLLGTLAERQEKLFNRQQELLDQIAELKNGLDRLAQQAASLLADAATAVENVAAFESAAGTAISECAARNRIVLEKSEQLKQNAALIRSSTQQLQTQTAALLQFVSLFTATNRPD